MLKSVGEECLSKRSVSEWHKCFKEGLRKWECKNRWLKLLTAFFYAKGIIYHEFVPEKQAVNDKFYKEVIKKLITRVHRVSPEFRENGSWYPLRNNAPAHSSGVVSEFLANRGIPVLSDPPYSPDLLQLTFFIS
jgi:hypothetical protein